MANDLIIGANTYKNIDYVQIRRADGTIAVYYDRNRIDNRVMTASCTKVDGAAYAVAATGLETDEPEAASISATAGGSYSESAELQTDTPDGTSVAATSGASYEVDSELQTEEPQASMTEGETE